MWKCPSTTPMPMGPRQVVGNTWSIMVPANDPHIYVSSGICPQLPGNFNISNSGIRDFGVWKQWCPMCLQGQFPEWSRFSSGCFFQEMVKKTMAFLIKYRQLCSCFPQMSLSTSSVHFNMCPKNSFEHPMDSHGQTAWHSKKHSRTRAPCPDCLPAAKNFKNMMLPGVDGFFGSIWFENMRVLMQLLTYGIMRCFSCCWIADLGMLKNVG